MENSGFLSCYTLTKTSCSLALGVTLVSNRDIHVYIAAICAPTAASQGTENVNPQVAMLTGKPAGGKRVRMT